VSEVTCPCLVHGEEQRTGDSALQVPPKTIRR
jgi:hypothetical protein